MKHSITCIICPRGCQLEVEADSAAVKVTGQGCIRGEKYGADEVLNPVRTVTSTVRVENRPDIMLSVKTAEPIKKQDIFKIMELIRGCLVKAPVKIGEIVLADVFGTNVIATKNIE